MDIPKFSIIIPAYNGAEHLGEAIQSVLNQTYQDFELIVVDDVSTDNTSEVVKNYTDPRIKYILQTHNQGANAARNTGVRQSRGEIIAFLDQDDLFHPDKLRTHAAFLDQHHHIGFTYNAHFEFFQSPDSIHAIRQPPGDLTLADLVLGFPISPSEMVIRRDWFQNGYGWDNDRNFNGAEITFAGRLFMSGCLFANVDRVLNYRRLYKSRRQNNLLAKCEAELSCQAKIFSDQRCPQDILDIKDIAYSNTYRIWAFVAMSQTETELGQDLLRKAIRLKPDMVLGEPNELVDFILYNCLYSDNLESEVGKILSQLPSELAWLKDWNNWIVAQGYLILGARAMIWGRVNDGKIYLNHALQSGAKVDELYVKKLTYDLINFENEFGFDAAQSAIDNISIYLKKISTDANIRKLKGNFAFNLALRSYRNEEYQKVLPSLFKAVTLQPRYLFNRGTLAIFSRSLFRGTAHSQGF